MGIFLIYVMAFLIFLRPGSQSIYKQDTLTGIVEYGFSNNSMFTIYKTPIFITPTNMGLGNYKIVIDGVNILEGENRNYAILDKDDKLLRFDLSGVGTKEIEFDGFIYDTNGINEFWLIYSEDVIYRRDPLQNDITIKDGLNFTYQFGVTQDLVGIKESKLIELNDTDYNKIKEDWNYPVSKDFSILIEEVS
jgi:hypothetical protein